HRRYFDATTPFDSNIVYQFDQNSTIKYLSSAFGEDSDWQYERYGMAKYLIIFEDTQHPERTIKFIYNTLDSKAGTRWWQGISYYGEDIKYHYNNQPDSSYVWIGVRNTRLDSVTVNHINKEVKDWKLFYDREEPWERKFYARSTPFGISPEVVIKYSRVFTLGTTVILDTVYSNQGNLDKYGYNRSEERSVGKE